VRIEDEIQQVIHVRLLCRARVVSGVDAADELRGLQLRFHPSCRQERTNVGV
jgi:hypothetical protein